MSCPGCPVLSSKNKTLFLPDPKIIVSLRRKSYRYEIPHRHTDIREHHQ